MLWCCWLGGRKGIRPVKKLSDGLLAWLSGPYADLHMAQLMPLPLTVSCYSKIYIGFTFLPSVLWRCWLGGRKGIPEKGPLNGCVCVCCPWLPGWASTRKVKPIWILLKQETVSGSGISWAVCKSAPRFRQITTSAPHHSVFYRPDDLPAAQRTASKHWRHKGLKAQWTFNGQLSLYLITA